MSLTLITNPPTALTVDTNWTTFVAREGVSTIGTGLSVPIFRLTNWDTGTVRPLVEEGSIVEVGGSLYQATEDTALVDDASLSDGLCYIKLVPDAGSPDPLTVIPTITNDAIPAFEADKGGWYDTDEKYLPFVMTRAGSGSSFTTKGEYVDQNKRIIHYMDGGSYFDGSSQVGGALTVGSGATFGGALSGITNITASGDISCDDISCDIVTANSVSSSNITASNSITASYITSGSSSLRWKRFSGSLNTSGDVNITHGIDVNYIYGVAFLVKNSSGYYYSSDLASSLSGNLSVYVNSTLISIYTSSGSTSNFIAQPYKVTLFYI